MEVLAHSASIAWNTLGYVSASYLLTALSVVVYTSACLLIYSRTYTCLSINYKIRYYWYYWYATMTGFVPFAIADHVDHVTITG